MLKKRNYWPLLFIGIFVFTLIMIIYTITSAIKTPVHEDKTFLKSYHDIDSNFNKIMNENKNFKEKYSFKMTINKKSLSLSTKDLFYSQRVLEKKSTHKDLLKKGLNNITIEVRDNKTQELVNSKINFRVTKSTNNKSDMDFSNKDKKTFSFELDIPIEGNWNITGTVKTSDNTGSFYIKTNAI